MKKLSLVLGFLMLGGLSLMAGDDKKPDHKWEASGSLNADEVRFVTKAAKSGHAEAAVGELGKTGAERGDVKSFADTLLDQHSIMNTDLLAIAEKNGVKLPDMAEHGKEMLGKLAKLKGAEFDQAFLTEIIAAHEKSIELFTKAKATVANEDLKKFVDSNLPKLEEHLKKARELQQEKAEDDTRAAQS